MTKKIPGVLLIAGLAAGSLRAGVVYEIEVKDHDVSPPREAVTEMAAEGRLLKMTIDSGGRGGDGDMIYRGDRREMVVVDHKDRSYYVMDQATIDGMAAQVGQAMAQMNEALKNVPPEQRAAIEQMMKQRMPQQAPERPVSEVRKTGERATHAGYPCVKYEVLRGGQRVSELWVTGWENLEGGKEVRALFLDLAGFFREMVETMSRAAGAGAASLGVEIEDHLLEVMDKIDGFPVVVRDFAGGALGSESTLRSAERRTLDPAAFEPPSGYKRRSMLPR